MTIEQAMKVLGVNSSYCEKDIKKAYHKLSIQYHPDKPDGDAEKMKLINKAYSIITDSKRAGSNTDFTQRPARKTENTKNTICLTFSQLFDIEALNEVYGVNVNGATVKVDKSNIHKYRCIVDCTVIIRCLDENGRVVKEQTKQELRVIDWRKRELDLGDEVIKRSDWGQSKTVHIAFKGNRVPCEGFNETVGRGTSAIKILKRVGEINVLLRLLIR